MPKKMAIISSRLECRANTLQIIHLVPPTSPYVLDAHGANAANGIPSVRAFFFFKFSLLMIGSTRTLNSEISFIRIYKATIRYCRDTISTNYTTCRCLTIPLNPVRLRFIRRRLTVPVIPLQDSMMSIHKQSFGN